MTTIYTEINILEKGISPAHDLIFFFLPYVIVETFLSVIVLFLLIKHAGVQPNISSRVKILYLTSNFF